MRVLIAGFDLFRSVGGGQTFYRGIIEANPQIEFAYLRDREPENAARPANAKPLAYRAHYGNHSLAGFAEPDSPNWAIHDFLSANNIARAASGQKFDVVDTPDYDRQGMFLRPALERHGGTVGKVFLSMHGGISTTVALNWGGSGKKLKHLETLERLQYGAADGRYFISPWYRDEWAGYSPLASHYLDPMTFFRPPPPPKYRPLPGPPSLLFVGRTEKRKGPQLFVQMAWWLPHESYRDALIVGPDVRDDHGKSSTEHLREMAQLRKLGYRVRFESTKTHAELAELYASNVLTVTPSQYDTLNLVALESLFAGCPTVIGNGAGACQYLRERFPGLPFVELDLKRFYGGIPSVEDALTNYEARRRELSEYLAKADFAPNSPPLRDIYATPVSRDSLLANECENIERKLGEQLVGV